MLRGLWPIGLTMMIGGWMFALILNANKLLFDFEMLQYLYLIIRVVIIMGGLTLISSCFAGSHLSGSQLQDGEDAECESKADE